MSKFKITWHGSGRKAQCPPDPRYPNGKPGDLSIPGVPSCEFRVPYPAPECGYYRAECKRCGYTMGVTAAGRPDDPTTVKIPCGKHVRLQGISINDPDVKGATLQ